MKFVVCLLAMTLAMPCALADLSRGSRGEEVRRLQSMLMDLGFLHDRADGVFGKKTQDAVRGIQRYWGVEETGVADEGVINDLEILWDMAMGVEREPGAPIDAGGYPACCSPAGDGDGTMEYCWRHIDVYPILLQLSAGRAPDELSCLLAERIREIWYSGILNMYAEQEAALPDHEKHRASDSLQAFEQELAQKRALWNETYGEGTVGAMLSEIQWLESAGVAQCFERHGAQATADVAGNWYADIQGMVAALILYEDGSYLFQMDGDVLTGGWALTGDALYLDAGTDASMAFAHDAAAQTLTRQDGYVFDRTFMAGWKPSAVRETAEPADFEGIWNAHHVKILGPLLPVEEVGVYMDAFILGDRASVRLSFADPLTYEGAAAFSGNALTLAAEAKEERGLEKTFTAQILEDDGMVIITDLPSGPAAFYLEQVQLLE